MNPSSERTSTVLQDVEINGSLTFRGELTFDGELRGGDIVGEALVIGPKARIYGNIQVTSLIQHGAVTGDVLVKGRCELKGSANLVGGLTTNRLVMDEGATMIGRAEITPDLKARTLTPSAR